MISVSIVSHGHGAMVESLVESLVRRCPEVTEIFITRNIPETVIANQRDRVKYIDNRTPKGFGANHNAAFRLSSQQHFCPLNPDISIGENPFPELLSAMNRTGSGLVAPVIRNPDGYMDGSLRRFPTIRSLVWKAFNGPDGSYSITEDQAEINPEWIAGMFMLFRSSVYANLGGFDERFFLYYEDVDICARARKLGVRITGCPRVSVLHDARRASHHNLTFLRWHLASMARYFWKHWGRLPH